MPYKPAIFFSTTDPHSVFLRVWPGAMSTRHMWRDIMRDDMYTRKCFSESEGTHLILEMSMNEAFIWLSGLCFIDKKKVLMAINFFWNFTENKPVRGLRKKYNIPNVNWLTDGGIY